MKNSIKIIFMIFICFFAINIVEAKYPYSVAEMKASQYVKTNINYVDTYEKYIYPVTSNISEFYKGYTSNNFKYGGLISYDEFKITKHGRVNNSYSYLYETSEYWTYTGEDKKRNIVSDKEKEIENIDDDDNKFEIKVTEIVKPTVNVIGTGTYFDPWIFEPQYTLRIRTNDRTKGKLKETKTGELKDVIMLTLTSRSQKDIYIEPQPGFEYLGHTCGAIINDIDVRHNSDNLKILSVTRNIECTINFGEKAYKIKLDSSKSYYDEQEKPNPENLYVIKNKAWYSDSIATVAISNLKKAPYLPGYEYQGYYTEPNYKNNRLQEDCYGSEIISQNNKLASPYLKLADDFGVEKTAYYDGMTIYPCFKPIKYTINYNCGIGATQKATATKSKIYTYNIPEKLELSSNECEKIGYVFKGWAKDINGVNTERYYDNASYEKITTTNEITLYAQWEPIKYTVIYDPNTASGNMNNQIMTYDKEDSLKNNEYSLEGHYFKGWSTNKNAKEATYQNKQSVKNLTTDPEITLYAIWKGQDVKVKFNTGYEEITGTLPEQVFSYKETYANLPTPVLDGYKFLGWYTSASGGTKVTSSTVVNTLAAHTLYAQWEISRIDLLLMFNGSGTNNFTSFALSGYEYGKSITYTGQTTQGKWESFSIRITDLEVGAKYKLKFDASFSDRTCIRDTTSYPIGCKVEDHLHYAQNESTEDYVWTPTDTNKSTKGFIIEFTANKSTMYWLWELSKIRNPKEAYKEWKKGVENFEESYFDLTLDNIEIIKVN